MEINLLNAVVNAVKKNQSYAFATIIETTDKGTPRKAGAKMVVLKDGTIAGTVGGGLDELKAKQACMEAIQTGKSKIIECEHSGINGEPNCGGKVKIFIEPFQGVKNLIICGAGHIALPLSAYAKMLNYHVTVIDNRKEFANKKRFPHADKIHAGDFAGILKSIEYNKNTFIVIATYGHQYDFECAKMVADKDVFYIGVVGSMKKRKELNSFLKQENFNETQINQIRIPSGLDIGAQTPEEIALSIISEIISVQNKDFTGSPKFKSKL